MKVIIKMACLWMSFFDKKGTKAKGAQHQRRHDAMETKARATTKTPNGVEATRFTAPSLKEKESVKRLNTAAAELDREMRHYTRVMAREAKEAI
jgi:hypothetical protein